jgi:hypothetical protein
MPYIAWKNPGREYILHRNEDCVKSSWILMICHKSCNVLVSQVQIAQDQLEELKDQHWALLSFYEMGQAEEKVKEAFLSLVQILTN